MFTSTRKEYVMPEINVPLLEKTLHFITDNPEEHDQMQWVTKTSCGTKGCLAYHAVIFAGHEATLDGLGYPAVRGTGESIHDAATRELGLSYDQAHNLFHYRNTLDGLWRLAEEFTHGAITRPERDATRRKP